MGNCLKTQLKESVINPSLMKPGEIEINVHTIPQGTLSARYAIFNSKNFEDKVTVYVVGNGTIATTYAGLTNDPKTSIDIPADGNLQLYFSNGDYDIRITNKYNISSFRFYDEVGDITDLGFSVNIDDLKWCDMFWSIKLPKMQIKGSLNSMYGYRSQLSSILISNCNYKGNISELGDLTRIEDVWLAEAPIVGDISVFGHSTYLSELTLWNTIVSGDISSLAGSWNLTVIRTQSTGITGTLESLATAMIANGRTSGTLYVAGNGLITYGGEPVVEKTITFSNGSYSVN